MGSIKQNRTAFVIPALSRDPPCPLLPQWTGCRASISFTCVSQHAVHRRYVGSACPDLPAQGKLGAWLHATIRHQAAGLVRSARDNGNGNHPREADQTLVARMEV